MDNGDKMTGNQHRQYLDERLNILGQQDTASVVRLYDEWGLQNYDGDMKNANRNGAAVFAKTISQEYTGDRATANILDVAAGTGLLAEQLIQEGFSRIDALDPSSGMLEVARQKNCYQNYFCTLLENAVDSIEEDYYDIVCSLGGIGPGHLKTEDLKQMYGITKPGGLLGICGKKVGWDSDPEYNVRMRQAITEMAESGRIVILRDTVIKEYFRPESHDWYEGVLIIMRKSSNA